MRLLLALFVTLSLLLQGVQARGLAQPASPAAAASAAVHALAADRTDMGMGAMQHASDTPASACDNCPPGDMTQHSGGSCTHCSLCHSAAAPPTLAPPAPQARAGTAPRPAHASFTSAPRAPEFKPPIA